MKSFIGRFVRPKSGAIDFEDGLTVFAMIIGFIVPLGLMHATIFQLFAAVSGLMPEH